MGLSSQNGIHPKVNGKNRGKRKRERKNMQPIHIPYNEKTKHIYEVYSQIAWEIATEMASKKAAEQKDDNNAD
jgi:hypothetical protein